MLGYCVLADVQFFADLNIGQATGDKMQYAHLALRKFHQDSPLV
jgi:hypothetical protein